MPSKQAILDNIEAYDASSLVQYIKDGIVTFEELCNDTDGFFPAKVRKEVERLLKGSEEDDWIKAKSSNSIELLEHYLLTYENGTHIREARELIRELLVTQGVRDAQDKWRNVDKNNIAQLQQFVRDYPNDPNCREAKKRINDLQKDEYLGFDIKALILKINSIQTNKTVQDPDAEIYNVISDYIDRNKITSADLLNAISSDNNLLRASTLIKLIEGGYLSYPNFEDIEIPREFTQHLANNEPSQRFAVPEKLDRINKISTEVYFWGIPSSGKTCAIGAILSVANNGSVALSMSKDKDCQGYSYMTRLASLFKTDGSVGTLPEGTSIYSTYEMGFDLESESHTSHPITCIDLAGELVRCMYKSDAKEVLSEDELEALDTLTRVLIDNRTKNRKMHFFVMEYGADKRKYEGLSQTDYLDAALQYIEGTGIFKKDTDAIYLMITKVDKVKAGKGELQYELGKYIKENYQGFYNGLKKICKDCEINDGKVDIIPFSLGKVCFQNYCMFSDAAATNVIKKILSRTKGFKNGKLQKGFNWFKK